MDCERTREHLEAYALDSLEPAERAEVERHLAICAECRNTADTLAELVARFPHALATDDLITPSEDIKARLLKTVSTRSLGAERGSSAAIREQPLRRSVPSPTISGRARRALRMLAYVAPALLLIVSLAWGFRLADALERERELNSKYVDLLGEAVGQQELVFEIVGFDDTNRQFLMAQQPESTSYGKVFTRPTMQYVVVMAGRLPDAPPNATFHVWVTAESQVSLAGELTIDEHGFGLLVFTAEQPGPAYESAFVTLQPPGGTSPGGTEILRQEESGSS